MIKYAHQYLLSAETICNAYQGEIPLTAFLKKYFGENKKFGSKDRKLIAHLCYCYFRAGHAIKGASVQEKIRASLFLCEPDLAEWFMLFANDWEGPITGPMNDRWDFVCVKFPGSGIELLFPWTKELSKGIDPLLFAGSHVLQPDLFLRIRPGKEKAVLEKLNNRQITYRQLSPTCLALPNASKLDTVLDIDREAVIQDYSSQRIGEFLDTAPLPSHANLNVWDCCAASGGKSILAYDLLPGIQLTVSDIRPSILHNLAQRFNRAGIDQYQSFIADLSVTGAGKNSRGTEQMFDLILCDAPCSGSGTWGRTPEQLHFFTTEKINEYSVLQKKIIANTLPRLKTGGCFLYITCSVFAKENEEQIAGIQKQFGLELIKMEVFNGYEHKADSMFAALLRKNENDQAENKETAGR